MAVHGGLTAYLQARWELSCYYNTLNLILSCIKRKSLGFFWDPKMVRKAKAWKGKLTWWSLHVKSGVLPFSFYAAWSFAGFSAPKYLGCPLQNALHMDSILPYLSSPSVCVSRSGDLCECSPPTGWMMSSTVPSWKCWGSFQPRWPSCWSCLRVVLFCYVFLLSWLV